MVPGSTSQLDAAVSTGKKRSIREKMENKMFVIYLAPV